MGRAPCCDKSNVKRGPWSPDEDATLKNYLHKHGTAGNWIALPKKAGLKRCGKSCRLRWLNYLRPHIKHGGFTEEEDNIIWSLYSTMGSRWSLIAAQLPGRTDNDVKNHWNTKLKKKFLAPKTRVASVNNGTISNTSSCSNHFSTFVLPPQLEAFVYDQKQNSGGVHESHINVFGLEQPVTSVPLPMPLNSEAFYTENGFSSSFNTPPLKEVSIFSNEAFLAEQNNQNFRWFGYDYQVGDDPILLEYVFDDLLNHHGFASQDKSSHVATTQVQDPLFINNIKTEN